MKNVVLSILLFAALYSGYAFAAVNVNAANADQLTQLPNIGPAKAQAIIKDREENGKYDSLDELDRVNGIGEKTVDDLRGEAVVASDDESSSASAE